MPRYFFHGYDGKEPPDNEGVELPNADEARREAVVATGDAIRDSSRTF